MRISLPLLLALSACQSSWEIIDTTPLGELCVFHVDADADGYGDPAESQEIDCERGQEGWVQDASDCDDLEASIHPGAGEVCDGEDNDCDGFVDDDDPDLEDGATWYADVDGDGYGDPETEQVACEPDSGWVEDGTDCDDDEVGVNPGADETCNELDDDCDGEVDEGLESTWFQDSDGDSHGDPATEQVSCDPGDGWVEDGTDCDDTDAAVSPSATELCNGVDDDCDSAVDDADPDIADASIWYQDDDVDGYGEDSTALEACEQPIGYAAHGGDCDDTDARYNPGAVEDDCDDPNDYNCDGSVSYADSDGDGWAACTECDDSDAAVNPGATELCNGVDDDCDGTIDEDDAADATTWYADGDADGYGDPDTTTAACSQPSGFVADSGDCDDSEAGVNPAATELCDGVDNDCDGSIDEDDAADAATWYADTDADGYGDAGSTTAACVQPSGYVGDDTDCDDGDAAVNPDAMELCDGVDNDCDGATDEDDAADAATWYADTDGDGYGDASASTTACTQPSGFVSDGDDCDDGDSAINPAATELCDGVDNDCDGGIDEDDAADATTWYADADSDGYGDAMSTTDACDQPSGYVVDASDCDDGSATVNPAATELCDGADNDCDGDTDEDDAADTTTWYADADADGHGDATSTADACEAPSGYVADSTDCDDSDGAVNPDATELCDGVDDDCDGAIDEDDAADASTWYADTDSDGFGDDASTTAACEAPSGFVADDTDCDDTDSAVNTAATELCNGEDDDCDGSIDEDDAADAATWYADSDADGYGDSASTTTACAQPSGYVADDTDCDDSDASAHPGATEVCDGADNDCDGSTDEADASDPTTWYADTDGDGYGDATAATTIACDAPSGHVADSTDCDDGDSSIHPGAAESCDGFDTDCDGLSDDDDPDAGGATWYLDVDLDGYGDASSSTSSCSEPSGYVADGTDCDDGDADINPDASEVCNGIDDDCDGDLDSSAVCPCNVERYSGHVYLFCETVSNWWNARADCLAEDNFDLVTVDDAAENAWLQSTAQGHAWDLWWWTGFHNQSAPPGHEPDGYWEWVDGSSSTYTNWNSGQPDDYNGDEDCGHIYGDSGAWNDMDCDLDNWYGDYLYFICESG